MTAAHICIRVALMAFGFAVAATCVADTWSPPKEATYTSADGRWRLTVSPRELSSQLAYFEDEVAGRDQAGALPGGDENARGHLQKQTEHNWATVWNENLLNDEAPVDVLVSSEGRVATLDNWYSMGYGDETIVVYDEMGLPVCSFGLYDLLPAVVVDNLPRSVSSIQWRIASRFSDDGHVLKLTIASPRVVSVVHGQIDRAENAFELGLSMSDCAVVPPPAEVWHEVVATAKQSQSDANKQRAAWRAGFIAPLSAPNDDDTEAWNRYLSLAWHRINTGKSDGYPRVQSLTPVGRPGHESSLDELREEWQLLTQWSDILVAGSASPNDLVAAIQEFAAGTPQDALRSRQIFLALADVDFATAREALLPTGADVVQIDPTVPLPQSEDNLRWLARDELAQAEEIAERERRAQGRAYWWLEY